MLAWEGILCIWGLFVVPPWRLSGRRVASFATSRGSYSAIRAGTLFRGSNNASRARTAGLPLVGSPVLSVTCLKVEDGKLARASAPCRSRAPAELWPLLTRTRGEAPCRGYRSDNRRRLLTRRQLYPPLTARPALTRSKRMPSALCRRHQRRSGAGALTIWRRLRSPSPPFSACR